MNILFVSDNKINGFGGGSIENKKYYDALKYYSESYNHNFKVISIDNDLENSLIVKINKSKLRDVLVRLKGHSSYMYDVWRENEKQIDFYSPDIIVLGRSRFGFIAKLAKLKWPNCRIITNVDNVEYDYVDAYFSNLNGFKKKIFKNLEYRCVVRDEKDAINYSDKLIYLTDRNLSRYEEIYGLKEKNPVVVPICLSNGITLTKMSEKKTVIFIGSLDYQANVHAVLKLISDIWEPYFKNNYSIRLVIAGRNPTKEIKQKCNTCENITLIENFCRLEDFVPTDAMMLAPIEKGAGMKVKVAETLSMGLMVAASDEALVGYNNIDQNTNLPNIIRANYADEYFQAINTYLNLNKETLNNIRFKNEKIFNSGYTYDTSRRLIGGVLDEIQGGIRNA
jgi:hypothetical protein